MKRIIIFLILYFHSTQVVTAANNKYSCSVEKVTQFSENKEFIAKNLRKTFLITVGTEKIYLTQISNDFANTQKIYKILWKNILGINSIDADSNSLLETLVFRRDGATASRPSLYSVV